VGFLNRHRIATRNLFAGNLIRQPYMLQQAFRVSGALTQTDVIMERTFWIGVYPGLTDDHIDYMADCMIEFAATHGA
jgi:CDP-6-deoxy-D-xylo-4-hexulose-3-dehydrase